VVGLNKNIAIILLWVFIFPVIFQPFHIIWHHSHGYMCEYGHCQSRMLGKRITVQCTKLITIAAKNKLGIFNNQKRIGFSDRALFWTQSKRSRSYSAGRYS
jgi:hypothetical protein